MKFMDMIMLGALGFLVYLVLGNKVGGEVFGPPLPASWVDPSQFGGDRAGVAPVMPGSDFFSIFIPGFDSKRA